MKSLGVIEIQGLVAAIQATDAACKAAGVTCIGYRKVGSGLVSVCFEGEISAIHTAIERGVAVVSQSGQVRSLVIARPERCVVDALSSIKGNPPRKTAARAPAVPTPERVQEPAAEQQRSPAQTTVDAPVAPASAGVQKPADPAPASVQKPATEQQRPPAQAAVDDKSAAPKKGRK